MTLYRSVEAAREALLYCIIPLTKQNSAAVEMVDNALSALPKQAMTEAEILNMVADKVVGGKRGEIMREIGKDMCLDVIRALREAGCLYVSEEKS